jgi:FolB domain-containing protein
MIVGISQLEVQAIIGCNPEERLQPQKLYIDLRLTHSAPLVDTLHATIDYVTCADVIQSVLQSGKYQLLETAVKQVAEQLFATFTKLEKVWVRIEKPGADPRAKSCFVEYEV